MTVTPPEDKRIAQLIDANLDRAREGLRVLEDWCRYSHETNEIVITLKNWRQELASHHHDFYRQSRATFTDKGLGLIHPAQQKRNSIEKIIIANSSRAQEALRVLEEYCRCNDPDLATSAAKIRYGTYQLEITLLNLVLNSSRRKILNSSFLYLITSEHENLYNIVTESLQSGIRIIQYRCKKTDDKSQYFQAKKLAKLCKKFNSLFIINDRIDLALAVNADGVHLGQDDMPVLIARRLLGKDKLIGKSTHSIRQIKEAEEEGCDYIGAGPIFSSSTKDSLNPLGIVYAKEALKTTRLPWFAIGGINNSNISELRSIGVNRFAMSGTLMNSDCPASEVNKILKMIS